MKDVVFSGIQPTGLIHVGNYLGPSASGSSSKDRCPCYYCVVGYHAITVPYDPADLPRRP